MPQTLTKPVLLDETGQEIAGKLDTNSAAIVDALDDIKGAISTSSEFVPIRIQIITPPTKTTYFAGETLDLTGMVVNAVGTNGVFLDVTDLCTCVPANGATLSTANDKITISYYWYKDDVTFTAEYPLVVRQLSSIIVASAPTKTGYYSDETLDLTGIAVTAMYSDGYSKDVTSLCTYSPADGSALTTSNTEVSISFTDTGVTRTTTQAIAVKELESIAVTTSPQTVYTTGDNLDLTGIVVTGTFTDGSTADVTSSCTFNPASGTTLSTANASVSISCTVHAVTKTTSMSITVTTPIYGAEWDGTASSVWTRTDLAADFSDPYPYYQGMVSPEEPSSPFDDIQPWAGMVDVPFSDESGYSAAYVAIPKFWYKLTQDGAKIKVQISNMETDGFHVSPAHMDRGDGVGERNVVYVAKYHTAKNSNINPYYNSYQSKAPTSNDKIADYRGYAQAHSDGDYWVMDYAMRFTIWLLYIVEFADWNSQNVIGCGCGDASTPQNNGCTVRSDLGAYHTGAYLNVSGTVDPNDRDSKLSNVKYRNIEGLWSGVFDFIDGCYFKNNKLYIILNPSDFNNSSGGVEVGTFDTQWWYPTAFAVSDVQGAFPLIVPTAGQGSPQTGTTYSCDKWVSTLASTVFGGGKYTTSSNQKYQYGINFLDQSNDGTGGARFMKLPANS